MSSQILKIVAAIMLIGSLILVAAAFRLGNPPQPSDAGIPAKSPENIYQIVTAARAIQSGETIRESDVVLAPMTVRPANAFDAPGEVLGKRLATVIVKGAPILQTDLAVGNPLTRSLKENERAIAIKVDEIIGVGGFVQPGDVVDVVAFMRADNQRIKENQAAVVLHSVRILSYGEELPAATGDKPASKDKSKTGRNTAVIVIDAEQTPLLTLMENSAVLRLALRPPGATDKGYQPYSITLGDIVAPATETFISEKSQGPMVEIYHGTHVEQVQYP